MPWDGFEPYAGSPYPLLSNEQICQFHGRFIREVAADNAIMFFWTTDKHLFDVPQILRSWGGFQLRYTMAWPKRSIGIGQYARGQHELVLVCTRGNFHPPEEHLRPSTLIVGPALDSADGFHFAPAHDGRHSSKPDQLYEKIEQSYPQYFGLGTVASPLALELFARNYRPKWDGQGFEYPSRPDDDLAKLEHGVTQGEMRRQFL
jgi:N6-adenosine-specific RNA methylase IME4